MAIRRAAVAIAFVGVLTLIGSVAALAAGEFTDVPDSNVFHNDIAWLADLGITKGCNPPDNTLFCPHETVTREQMAAFMHRFGNLPVETTIAIDQFGFAPIRDNHEFIDYDYSGVAPLGRYSSDILGTSVPVPDGAVITGFSATFCDSTSAEDYNATLIRRPDPHMTMGYAEVMAEIESKGDGCAITGSTTAIQNARVDTSSYSYAILVRTVGGSGSVNIRRATITYERPLVP